MASSDGVPPRRTHDPNSGKIRPNRVKHLLAAGGTAFIAAGELNWTGDSIDALGPSNFDGVWLEGEHGPLDFADIGNLGRACDLWGMTSIARVKKALDKVDENVIYRTLDRGVQGIIVPHVNTKAEAEMVVAASKFKNDEFPMGRRGMFLSRQGFGVADYYMRANHETLTVILIEDIIAVNNLAEILEVDHIDVFHVAYADLAQSMGYLHDLGNPKVKEVTERAIKQIIDAGRTCGTSPLSMEEAQHHHAMGARFFYIQPVMMVKQATTAYFDAVDPTHATQVASKL